MSARHTPGPWLLCDEGDYGDYDGHCRIILGNVDRLPVRLAAVLMGGNEPMQAENNANARLLAAAPDLLTALQEMVMAAEGAGLDAKVRRRDAMTTALTVLAKARGEVA